MKYVLHILLSLLVLTNCSIDKPAEPGQNSYTRIDTTIVDTVHYADFRFHKVIAFATVNPFDPNYLVGQKKMVLSEFGDTISRILNESQTNKIIKILSGKSRKDTLSGLGADCHNPRHNIAFLDQNDSVINYISVCFECHTIVSTKPQKGGFIAFEDFFNAIGLKVFDDPDYYKLYYDSIAKLRPHRKLEVAPNEKRMQANLELFIDSMKSENFFIDTNRFKQVVWYNWFHHPKTMQNGYALIEMPFPVDKFKKHFSNSKTYFFAKWNEQKKTFKEGIDYLLMTWSIDSAGIANEKEIYASLHEKMGNFPCYIFRSNHTVYAMANRLTVYATPTRILTESLRNYIKPASILYRPFNGKEPI